jgi:hypothetical protein
VGDDAKIDEELMFIRAVADIAEWHIRLLRLLLREPPLAQYLGGWTPEQIASQDPGLASGVMSLLRTLELHGLVASKIVSRNTPIAASSWVVYSITPAGRDFLLRLEGDAETVAGKVT